MKEVRENELPGLTLRDSQSQKYRSFTSSYLPPFCPELHLESSINGIKSMWSVTGSVTRLVIMENVDDYMRRPVPKTAFEFLLG